MSFPCDCHPIASFLFPKEHPDWGGGRVECECVRLHSLCKHTLTAGCLSSVVHHLTHFLRWSLAEPETCHFA